MTQATLTEREARPASDEAPVGTSRRHTSEPRWPTDRPALDPAARALLIVAGEDEGAQASLLAWTREAAEAGIGAAVALLPPDREAIASAAEAAASGTRMVAAGDEAVLSLAASAAAIAGWAPSELRAHLTAPNGPRPVQCVHCRHITPTTARVEETADCDGCGVPLLLFPHWSRRIGAYMGFRVDAEELP